MQQEVIEHLLNINRQFYREFSRSFAETRNRPQPGFDKLLSHLPQEPFNMLDVGCGEGRLGRFFSEKSPLASYCGVDFSEDLITIAENQLPGNYFIRDFSTEGCLSDLGQFDVIACLATLQHVPDIKRRSRLMVELASHLEDGGCIFLSTWQFLSSARQRRKIVEWPAVGISSNAVEDDDYLLTWSRDGSGLRYVCSIDSTEIKDIANHVGLSIVHQFRSDGKEGDLNLYAILRNE